MKQDKSGRGLTKSIHLLMGLAFGDHISYLNLILIQNNLADRHKK